MSIITFIIILAVLVFVHELGHFLVAKFFGIRVDEFSIGFPPRIFKKKVGETLYSINLIPFGGYVKIFGENPDEESMTGEDSARSFVNKSKKVQAGVLLAGVLGNVIFAWLLISAGNVFGMPTAVTPENESTIINPQVVITSVSKNSPAFVAGVKPGDAIVSASVEADSISGIALTPESAQEFIGKYGEKEITFKLSHGKNISEVKITPKLGIVADRSAVGITMDYVGLLRLPIWDAFFQGALSTYNLVKSTAVGLYTFVSGAFVGKTHLEDVTGPVGIAGMVGVAQSLGFAYLIYFTALISINLAVINLVPFPALDGGRILFVAIEAVRRKSMSPRVANTLNGIGFALLILLMIVVTYKDIVKLF